MDSTTEALVIIFQDRERACRYIFLQYWDPAVAHQFLVEAAGFG